MKKRYIIQLQNDLEKEDEKVVLRAEEIFDSENFITSIVEVDDIEVRDDEDKILVYDKDTQKVILKAEKKPITTEEEIKMLKGSIVELSKMLLEEEE